MPLHSHALFTLLVSLLACANATAAPASRELQAQCWRAEDLTALPDEKLVLLRVGKKTRQLDECPFDLARALAQGDSHSSRELVNGANQSVWRRTRL